MGGPVRDIGRPVSSLLFAWFSMFVWSDNTRRTKPFLLPLRVSPPITSAFLLPPFWSEMGMKEPTPIDSMTLFVAIDAFFGFHFRTGGPHCSWIMETTKCLYIAMHEFLSGLKNFYKVVKYGLVPYVQLYISTNSLIPIGFFCLSLFHFSLCFMGGGFFICKCAGHACNQCFKIRSIRPNIYIQLEST